MEASTRRAWVPQTWRNKIAAGFTNSGSWHGDKLNSLVTLALFAAQHGMIWTGLTSSRAIPMRPKTGLAAGWARWPIPRMNRRNSLPIQSDLDTAAYLGERVARVTLQFARGAE